MWYSCEAQGNVFHIHINYFKIKVETKSEILPSESCYLWRECILSFTKLIDYVKMTILVSPGANPDFQFIKIPNQEIQAPVGETIVIEVATDSPATFTWFKDDEEIFM